MSINEDFQEFWRVYPRKVGKLAAQKQYEKVRKAGICHEELMNGITNYREIKPPYADWCHPATWLSQGRWLDEPDVPLRPYVDAKYTWECPHQPHCRHRAECAVVALRKPS